VKCASDDGEHEFGLREEQMGHCSISGRMDIYTGSEY